jgi:hypothetical protein
MGFPTLHPIPDQLGRERAVRSIRAPTYAISDIVLNLDFLLILLVGIRVNESRSRQTTRPQARHLQAACHSIDKGRRFLRVERIKAMRKGTEGNGIKSELGEIVDNVDLGIAKSQPLPSQHHDASDT